jgi:hypothetical protein
MAVVSGKEGRKKVSEELGMVLQWIVISKVVWFSPK